MKKSIMNFLNENLSIEETDFELRKFNIIIGYEKNFISRLIYLAKRAEDVVYIPSGNFSLLTLQTLKESRNKLFIIEDIDVFLHPMLHKKVVFDIAKICNEFNNSVVITTNSPYILSSFNILLLANNVMNEKNKEKIEKNIGRNTAIKFEDITAYEVVDGVIKPFLNHENKLLDTNVIDKATEELEDLFDKINEIGLWG
jgi:hypothetical protein